MKESNFAKEEQEEQQEKPISFVQPIDRDQPVFIQSLGMTIIPSEFRSWETGHGNIRKKLFGIPLWKTKRMYLRHIITVGNYQYTVTFSTDGKDFVAWYRNHMTTVSRELAAAGAINIAT